MTTTARAAQLEAKARETIAARSTEQLCYDYAATEGMVMTDPAVPMVRGWLMDELEKRDAEAFDKWMFSDESLPHSFYGVAPAQLI